MKKKKGYIHATPCPTCNKPQDFRDVPADLLERGTKFTCDKCQRPIWIAQATKMVILLVQDTQPPEQSVEDEYGA